MAECKISHICEKCNSNNVDIFSVRETSHIIDDIFIPSVDISYVCTDCGNVYTTNEFLYGLKQNNRKEDDLVCK